MSVVSDARVYVVNTKYDEILVCPLSSSEKAHHTLTCATFNRGAPIGYYIGELKRTVVGIKVKTYTTYYTTV
eukprot:7660679-Pyramimonas_sp.AAC.4